MTQRTDSEILAWLLDNVTYIEHGDREAKDAFWPHIEPFDNEIDYSGLDLREYIESRMEPQA